MVAKIRTGSRGVKTTTHTHTAALSAGDVLVVGNDILIAINDVEADTEGVYAYATRKLELPKVNGTAFAFGAKVYWDVADGNINDDNVNNKQAGICVEAAAAGDATIVIEHQPNVA